MEILGKRGNRVCKSGWSGCPQTAISLPQSEVSRSSRVKPWRGSKTDRERFEVKPRYQNLWRRMPVLLGLLMRSHHTQSQLQRWFGRRGKYLDTVDLHVSVLQIREQAVLTWIPMTPHQNFSGKCHFTLHSRVCQGLRGKTFNCLTQYLHNNWICLTWYI